MNEKELDIAVDAVYNGASQDGVELLIGRRLIGADLLEIDNEVHRLAPRMVTKRFAEAS